MAVPLAWVERLAVRDLRNIHEATLDLHPAVNVFHGRNAQGKTSLLEAVGLLARGRSFRTEHAASMIRSGAGASLAQARGDERGVAEVLEVELRPTQRLYRLDGREVPQRDYRGRLEVVVYSTDRLRVIHGAMRERRQYLDRQAAALWPSYQAELRVFERLLTQRNAALAAGARDTEVWTERFVESAARLRRRRAHYAARLTTTLATGFRPAGESYAVRCVEPPASEDESVRQLSRELDALAGRERAAGRTLAGPHRDAVAMLIDEEDAALNASSGQARSLLLALTLAALRVHHEETGRAAVALLDDLDSELDAERAGALCEEVARRGQALVTSAHPGWAESLRPLGHIFHVSEGQVRCA
jgi:DNA replication and repair protein RecF